MLALLGPIRYAAANASVRARLGQLLPAHLWRALLASPDLDELVALLNRSAYGAALAPVTGQPPAPEQLEQALWTYLARASRAPLKLIQGSPRTLLDWLWRRFELDNLKTLLRAVAAEVPADQIRAALTPLEADSELPWTALSEAGSAAEVVDRLHSTFHGLFYARALDQALDRYRREGEIFVLEVALDLAYYRRLLWMVQSLGGRDRREAERLIGLMVDSQNLLWALRYRIYFDLSPEEILAYTLQRRLRVDAAVVRQIATGAAAEETGEIEAIVRQVWAAGLPGLDRIAELSPQEALPELELLFRRQLHHLALEARRGYPFHLGAILAYELLLEAEIRDLIAVIEGKASGWSAERIESHLIASRG